MPATPLTSDPRVRKPPTGSQKDRDAWAALNKQLEDGDLTVLFPSEPGPVEAHIWTVPGLVFPMRSRILRAQASLGQSFGLDLKPRSVLVRLWDDPQDA